MTHVRHAFIMLRLADMLRIAAALELAVLTLRRCTPHHR